jgi:hypothetical protein
VAGPESIRINAFARAYMDAHDHRLLPRDHCLFPPIMFPNHSNGGQFGMVVRAALIAPVSRQWKGYWQRRAAKRERRSHPQTAAAKKLTNTNSEHRHQNGAVSTETGWTVTTELTHMSIWKGWRSPLSSLYRAEVNEPGSCGSGSEHAPTGQAESGDKCLCVPQQRADDLPFNPEWGWPLGDPAAVVMLNLRLSSWRHRPSRRDYSTGID